MCVPLVAAAGRLNGVALTSAAVIVVKTVSRIIIVTTSSIRVNPPSARARDRIAFTVVRRRRSSSPRTGEDGPIAKGARPSVAEPARVRADIAEPADVGQRSERL